MRAPVPVLVLSFTLAASAAAQQQMPDGSANKAAIERLRFMEGTWRGEGWMQIGRERISSTVTETVERRIDGVVLLVNGRGMNGGRVVHDALGVIAYNAQAARYLLRSWVGSGMSGEFQLELVDGGVTWSREVPGGRVRYLARISATEWHETGEFSRDGTTWLPIMEMRLQKQP